MSERNINVDIARGMVILYIITIVHGGYWLGVLSGPYKSWILFEMPIIFMVSGYSFALFERRGFVLTVGNYVRYLYARSVRILLPYWAYAFICAVVVVIMQQTFDAKTLVLTFADWLNPVTRGTFHPFGVLSWHLWFIFPFLVVTGMLPILTHMRFPLWSAFSIAAIASCFSRDTLVCKAVITPIFYLFWAYAGYFLALGSSIKRYQHVLIVLAGIAILGVLRHLDMISLNMQEHKFPPTLVFMVFSAVWASILLLIVSNMNLGSIRFLADIGVFKVFMERGYSIFLWQGAGYTVATMIGTWLQWGPYSVWVLAIILTVGLGTVFGAIENIRLRKFGYSTTDHR